MAVDSTRLDKENGLSKKRRSTGNVIDLMQQWLDDKSDYDAKVWPELKMGLERDRRSARQLFHG